MATVDPHAVVITLTAMPLVLLGHVAPAVGLVPAVSR